jgi:hypothetical protein
LRTRGCISMEYEIKLVNVEKDEMERKHWATVVYRFSISSGSANTYGDVVLTAGGVNIIEKNGRDLGIPEHGNQ